tara:strand:- start:19412 stop:22864 length:3453 start_codon:yes stop_codon:yes gene_type:complete
MSDLWEELTAINAFKESETIQQAYAGALDERQRAELETALYDKYNLNLKQLRPESDPIYAGTEGGRSAIINQMLGMGAELTNPLREAEVVDTTPIFSPVGGVPSITTDIGIQEGDLRELIDKYTFENADYLEQQGVDIAGIPRNPDDIGARSGDDPQLLLSRLPSGADQMYATRRVITDRIKQELPDFTEDQLSLYRDPVTDTLIFDNPLNNNQPTTVPTLGVGKGQAVLDWFRKEGPELLTILGTGILGTVGGIKVEDMTPGGRFKKGLQTAIGPITGGAMGDTTGQFIWDMNNMLSLRDKGLLDPEQWTDEAIFEEAGRNAAMTGGFSLGSAALFNVALKAMGVKGVWSGDFDDKAVHKAIKKGMSSESSAIDPAGIGFWDKGSALRFIKRKIEADQMPETMKEMFPDPNRITWSDKYWSMGSDEALSIARNIVAHETGDNTILLGKTLPQMIKMAQDKGLLTAEDSVGIGNIVDFQTILHALRSEGNAQARKMIDDVLRPQEQFIMNQYSDNLYAATGLNINKIREGFGEKFYQSFGEVIESEVGKKTRDRLRVMANNVDNLGAEFDTAINSLGRGAMDPTEAGGMMREEVITPIYRKAVEEKDALYAELYNEAGGKVKKWDITSVVNDVKAFEKVRARQWKPRQGQLDGKVERFIDLMKESPLKRNGEFRLQSFDDIQGSLVNARAIRSRVDQPQDIDAMDAMIDILETYRAQLLKNVGGDTAIKAEAAEQMWGEIQDTFNAGIIKKVLNQKSDLKMIDNLLNTGNRADDALIRKAIFESGSPEAEQAVMLVQGSLKKKLIDLGVDIETGLFRKENMTEAAFTRFYKENKKLIDEFFDPDEAKLFGDLPKLKNALVKEISDYDREISKLKNNKTLKGLGLNFDDLNGIALIDDPEWFFNNIFLSKGGVGSITRVEKFMNAIPDTKIGNKLHNNMKVLVGADLDKSITIPKSTVGGNAPLKNFSGGMIDPMRLRTYLKTHGDSLDTIYGPQFREGLEEYQKMLTYFMPEGGTGRRGVDAGDELLQGVTGNAANLRQTVNGLTRAYIGIFTRPGRFLTAGLGAVTRAEEKKALELMLYPDKFMNQFQIRQFLKSPVVQTIIRNYGRPIWEKDTTLQEDIEISTEDVAGRIQFKNYGGSVKLIPLEYDL